MFSSRDDSSQSAGDRTPTTTTSEPGPTAGAPACDRAVGAWLHALNTDRVARGLDPLCANAKLAAFAQQGADLMAASGSLTHRDLDAAMGSLAVSTIGENLFVGPAGASATDVDAAWMASAPHRANVLSVGFSAAGVGVATGADGRVWLAVDFAG
jgi:uncharacterized protein YkwD